MKIFATVVSVIVLVIVVVGFIFAGSPRYARLERFDEMRVRDLQQIESYAMQYWELHDRLPATVDEAIEALSVGGMAVPVDPETGEEYTYTTGEDLTFSLCATFATAKEPGDEFLRFVSPAKVPLRDNVSYRLVGSDWGHPAGEHCFERRIEVIDEPAEKT